MILYDFIITCSGRVENSHPVKQIRNARSVLQRATVFEPASAASGEDAFINIKYMIPTYESCSKA